MFSVSKPVINRLNTVRVSPKPRQIKKKERREKRKTETREKKADR